MDWKLVPELPQVFIIENFYDDVDWVIPYLRTQEPVRSEKANYGGLSYLPPLEKKQFALSKISKYLGINVGEDEKQEYGRMRYTNENSKSEYRSFVHFDICLNVLIYLSGKESESGGTSFYRHKDLGMTFIHPDRK